MAKLTKEQVVEYLENLTLLEASELVKELAAAWEARYGKKK